MTETNNKLMSEQACNLVCAADLGGTHLRVAVVDSAGHIHFRLKQSTPQEASPDGIMRSLVSAVRECEVHAKQNGGRRISAVSVVVPGTVNVDRGIVVKAPNLSALDGFHLSEQLTSQLGYSSVLQNDANAAAVGEMWMGAGRGRSAIVCVTLGTGVGGGIILNGKLWRGGEGDAGENGQTWGGPGGRRGRG